MNELNKIIYIVCFNSMEEERLADMVVVEYGPTEMDITVCVTELGGGAHTPAAGPITNYQLHHY